MCNYGKILIQMYSEDEGKGSLTRDMDQYLVSEYMKKRNATYLCDYGERKESKCKEVYTWAIRVPGATRGHIITNKDGIIEEIQFYEDTCFKKLKCYREQILTLIPKYIGCKLVTQREVIC